MWFRIGIRTVTVGNATPDSLRTTVVAGDRVLLEVTSPGADPRRAMIASYYAPRTDFRAGLIKNLFRG